MSKEYSVAEHYYDWHVGQAMLRLVSFDKMIGSYWTRSRARAEAMAAMFETGVLESREGYDFVVVERDEGSKRWEEVSS